MDISPRIKSVILRATILTSEEYEMSKEWIQENLYTEDSDDQNHIERVIMAVEDYERNYIDAISANEIKTFLMENGLEDEEFDKNFA